MQWITLHAHSHNSRAPISDARTISPESQTLGYLLIGPADSRICKNDLSLCSLAKIGNGGQGRASHSDSIVTGDVWSTTSSVSERKKQLGYMYASVRYMLVTVVTKYPLGPLKYICHPY